MNVPFPHGMGHDVPTGQKCPSGQMSPGENNPMYELLSNTNRPTCSKRNRTGITRQAVSGTAAVGTSKTVESLRTQTRHVCSTEVFAVEASRAGQTVIKSFHSWCILECTCMFTKNVKRFFFSQPFHALRCASQTMRTFLTIKTTIASQTTFFL